MKIRFWMASSLVIASLVGCGVDSKKVADLSANDKASLSPLEKLALEKFETIENMCNSPLGMMITSKSKEAQENCKKYDGKKVSLKEAVALNKAAAEKEAKEQAEAKAKAEAAKEFFNSALVAVVTEKKNHGSPYRSDGSIEFKAAFTNKSGDKTIKGIKYVTEVRDQFGGLLVNLESSANIVIKPNETVVRSAYMDPNQFKNDDMKVWDTGFSDLQIIIKVEAINYSDGSKMVLP